MTNPTAPAAEDARRLAEIGHMHRSAKAGHGHYPGLYQDAVDYLLDRPAARPHDASFVTRAMYDALHAEQQLWIDDRAAWSRRRGQFIAERARLEARVIELQQSEARLRAALIEIQRNAPDNATASSARAALRPAAAAEEETR